MVTSDGQSLSANKDIKHFRGIVKGDPNSLVAISFMEDEVIGLIATDEGNFNLALDKISGRHIFYSDRNLKEKLDFQCETHGHGITDYDPEILSQASKSSISSEDVCVRFYFETEHDIFQTRGSVASVESFVAAVFNQVATLYQNENIETSISEIFVWTTVDPYTSNNLGILLQQFQTNRTIFNGDLGQLLTFRTDVGGGIAALEMDGICNPDISERLSVAMLHNNYETVPTYSWTVHIVAHEFGHLFGSRHTHACVWNGNNTAIDGCWGCMENPDPNGGGCQNCPNPGVPSGGGTIMSYCHLQSVGVNFNLGFGLQPGNVIRNSVANADCLCECVSATISGPDFLCSSDTYTLQNAPVGSTVSWSTSPAGMAGISGSGNSVNLTPQGNGQVTLTATITTDCGDVEVQKTFVTATGPIPTSAISLEPFESSPYVCPNQTFGFYPGPNQPWYQYEVQVTNGHYTEVSHGYFWIHFNNYTPSPPFFDASVSVRIHNGCFWSDWKSVSMYTEPSCAGGGCELCFLTFPNPVDDELQVQWNPLVKRMEGDDSSFDVQLYDQRGELVFSKSGIKEKISMDTHRLKSGFYYLHIRYKEGLIRRQIRVER